MRFTRKTLSGDAVLTSKGTSLAKREVTNAKKAVVFSFLDERFGKISNQGERASPVEVEIGLRRIIDDWTALEGYSQIVLVRSVVS